MVVSTLVFGQTNVSNVKEQPLSGKVKIYPNPVHDNLTIHFKDSNTPVSVSLYDGNGKEVYSDVEVMGLMELSISTSGFKKGMYTLKIKDKNNEESQRVIIN
jgi:hypothetical protein